MNQLSALKTFGLFLFFSLFLGSCKKNEPLKENDIQFSDIRLDTTSHLFNDTTKPGCTFKLDMQYPSSAHDAEQLKKLQGIFNSDYFSEKYATLSPNDAARTYMKDYVANYMSLEKDYEMLSRQVEEGMSFASFNYEEISSSEVTFNMGDFISYTVNFYNFTGGAHGMQSAKNHVIDLKTMNQLTLNDLFAEENYQHIANLIINEIAKSRGSSSPTQLNEDGFFSIEEVMPTENFSINEKAITWTYNPYEIAVYAIGIVNVSLPWEEVIHYMRDDSPVSQLARSASNF